MPTGWTGYSGFRQCTADLGQKSILYPVNPVLRQIVGAQRNETKT
jgi:hypothetical protein